MTHRDRAGDPPGRREAAGDAGHRQGFPTPSGGSPARPERRLPKAFGRPIALRRGTWLPMSRIATPRACSPKALGSRLYGSLLRTFGIKSRERGKPHSGPQSGPLPREGPRLSHARRAGGVGPCPALARPAGSEGAGTVGRQPSAHGRQDGDGQSRLRPAGGRADLGGQLGPHAGDRVTNAAADIHGPWAAQAGAGALR